MSKTNTLVEKIKAGAIILIGMAFIGRGFQYTFVGEAESCSIPLLLSPVYDKFGLKGVQYGFVLLGISAIIYGIFLFRKMRKETP